MYVTSPPRHVRTLLAQSEEDEMALSSLLEDKQQFLKKALKNYILCLRTGVNNVAVSEGFHDLTCRFMSPFPHSPRMNTTFVCFVCVLFGLPTLQTVTSTRLFRYMW